MHRPEIGKLVKIADRGDSLLLNQPIKGRITSTNILFDILFAH
jgi:hypothetical protein